jgi:phosphoribosylamine--glycine ligase
MNILVIGSGGREHAIIQALRKSKNAHRLFIAPGNPGIAQNAEIVEVDVSCAADILLLCRNNEIKLVIIGPEQPIAAGLADELRF